MKLGRFGDGPGGGSRPKSLVNSDLLKSCSRSRVLVLIDFNANNGGSIGPQFGLNSCPVAFVLTQFTCG